MTLGKNGKINQNNMETAVEYYESLMKLFDRWLEKKEISIDQYNSEKDKLIKQVKAIEKQQMLNAFQESRLTHPMIGFKHETFIDYYNETFKKNEDTK